MATLARIASEMSDAGEDIVRETRGLRRDVPHGTSAERQMAHGSGHNRVRECNAPNRTASVAGLSHLEYGAGAIAGCDANNHPPARAGQGGERTGRFLR